jgi:hypothetical protein
MLVHIHNQSGRREGTPLPRQKRKPITFRSTHSPVITMSKLLLSPKETQSGKFIENQFTHSTLAETSIFSIVVQFKIKEYV